MIVYDPQVADAIVGTLFWGAKFPSEVYDKLRPEFGADLPPGQPEEWRAALEVLIEQGRVRRTSSGRVRKVRFWEARRVPKPTVAAGAH